MKEDTYKDRTKKNKKGIIRGSEKKGGKERKQIIEHLM
jgi:hypothetical protein